MASYARLPGEPSETNIDHTAQKLKEFSALIKKFSKADLQNKKGLMPELMNLQFYLQNIFSTAKVPKEEKGRLETLLSQYKELLQIVQKQTQEFNISSEEGHFSSGFPTGVVEYDNLAIYDTTQLKKQVYEERQEKIQELHKDMVVVNEMFKDMSNLVKEQGEMLNVVERHVDVAVKETDVAAKELIKASDYQAKANKKKICLYIVLALIILSIVFSFLKYSKEIFSFIGIN